jgi:predicted dehydrogenase
MNKIGLGIIGLGVIGERLMPTFLKHPNTDIKGVYDVDTKRMKEMSDRFKLRSVDHYDALIEDESIDVIYLAVPPKFHHEISLKIMRAGKHILCEKPLAGTIEEAKEMFEVAKETHIIHGMNFPLYYGYGYNKIKEMIKNQDLGRIKRVEVTAKFPVWPRPWQQNNWIDTKEEGGFVREVFTHFIQLIQSSYGLIENVHSFVEYPEDTSQCEIGLIGVGELADGVKVLFNGITDINQKEDLRFTIYGSNGVVEMLNWRDLYLIENDERTFIEPESVDATYNLIDAFYNAVEGKNHNLVTFEDGLNATLVVEKLLEE